MSLCIALGLVLAITADANAGSTSHGSAEPESHTDVAANTHGADDQNVKEEDKDARGGSHWSYSGKIGPQNWGRLSKDYHACMQGGMQSPIDIANGFSATGEPIAFDYRLSPLEIVHNGHTVQVNFEHGSAITVSDKRYELLQLHFHTPSEHAVGHRRAAMEVHFVHKSADGQLAVVGAMMEAGGENLALREIWAHLPKKAGPAKAVEQVLINGRDLLPRDRGYYRYMGSLTTPPCSEGVNWFVLTQPITVGMAQVERFARAVGENARPLQPLNNRLVLAPGAPGASTH